MELDAETFVAQLADIQRHLRRLSSKAYRDDGGESDDDADDGDDVMTMREELSEIESAGDLERALVGILTGGRHIDQRERRFTFGEDEHHGTEADSLDSIMQRLQQHQRPESSTRPIPESSPSGAPGSHEAQGERRHSSVDGLRRLLFGGRGDHPFSHAQLEGPSGVGRAAGDGQCGSAGGGDDLSGAVIRLQVLRKGSHVGGGGAKAHEAEENNPQGLRRELAELDVLLLNMLKLPPEEEPKHTHADLVMLLIKELRQSKQDCQTAAIERGELKEQLSCATAQQAEEVERWREQLAAVTAEKTRLLIDCERLQSSIRASEEVRAVEKASYDATRMELLSAMQQLQSRVGSLEAIKDTEIRLQASLSAAERAKAELEDRIKALQASVKVLQSNLEGERAQTAKTQMDMNSEIRNLRWQLQLVTEKYENECDDNEQKEEELVALRKEMMMLGEGAVNGHAVDSKEVSDALRRDGSDVSGHSGGDVAREMSRRVAELVDDNRLLMAEVAATEEERDQALAQVKVLQETSLQAEEQLELRRGYVTLLELYIEQMNGWVDRGMEGERPSCPQPPGALIRPSNVHHTREHSHAEAIETESGSGADDKSSGELERASSISVSNPRDSYDRIFSSMLSAGQDGHELLTRLYNNLKELILRLAPAEGGQATDDALLELLSDCLSFAIEGLDRLDWLAAQLQEVEAQRNNPQRTLLRRSAAKGIFFTITSAPASVMSVPGLWWSEPTFDVRIESMGSQWSVQRALSEFRGLHGELENKISDFHVEFPNDSSKHLEVDLTSYMTDAWRHATVPNSREMLLFLCR